MPVFWVKCYTISQIAALTKTKKICRRKSTTWNEDAIMDTDDLTPMAYESIIIVNQITDFLHCDLGVQSNDYKDENVYLNEMLKFILNIKYYSRFYQN